MRLLLMLILALAAPAAAQTPVFSAQDTIHILEQVQQQCPRAWQKAHRDGDPERWDFMRIAIPRLEVASGANTAGNFRRGVRGDLSMDGVSAKDTAGIWRFYDVIGGAGGSNPTIGFSGGGDLRDSSGRYIGEAGVAFARDIPPPVVPCETTTVPGGPTGPGPPVDILKPVMDALAELKQRINDLHAKTDALFANERVQTETIAHIDGEAQAVRQALDRLEAREISWPSYQSNRLPIVGTIHLEPKK